MGIVLRNGSVLPLSPRVIEPVKHGVSIPVIRNIGAAQSGDRSYDIHKRARLRSSLGTFPSRRPTNNQWHSAGMLIHTVFPP